MKKKQYQYQGFLLQCPYSEIKLEKHIEQMPIDTQSFVYERNLLDYPDYKRQISLSFLDCNVDSEKDFKQIIHSVKEVQTLYIVDDRMESENTFVQKHSDATKQAFVWRMENEGISCYLTKPISNKENSN